MIDTTTLLIVTPVIVFAVVMLLTLYAGRTRHDWAPWEAPTEVKYHNIVFVRGVKHEHEGVQVEQTRRCRGCGRVERREVKVQS